MFGNTHVTANRKPHTCVMGFTAECVRSTSSTFIVSRLSNASAATKPNAMNRTPRLKQDHHSAALMETPSAVCSSHMGTENERHQVRKEISITRPTL